MQTGFECIRHSPKEFEDFNFVVTFDADGQRSLNDIELFLGAFITVPDLSIALESRFLSIRFKGSSLKFVVLKIMAFTSQYTVGIKLTYSLELFVS